MKTFTVKNDQVSVGIPVYMAENNDYYIRLSNSSYPPNVVRRYLSRNSPPDRKDNMIYDLDYYYDSRLDRTFLCKSKVPKINAAIVLFKHNNARNLKSRSIIYKDPGAPYMLIEVYVNQEILFFVKNEDGNNIHYRMYLDKDMNLYSVQVLK
jgi:hypothetical protein